MSKFKKDMNKTIQKIYKTECDTRKCKSKFTKKSERILRLKFKDVTAQKELSF